MADAIEKHRKAMPLCSQQGPVSVVCWSCGAAGALEHKLAAAAAPACDPRASTAGHMLVLWVLSPDCPSAAPAVALVSPALRG